MWQPLFAFELSRCAFQRRGYKIIGKIFCYICRALLVSINQLMLITEMPIARPIKKVSGSRTARSSWRQPWQDFSSRPPCSSFRVLRALSKCAAKYARCKYESPPPPLGLRGCKVLAKVARYRTCAFATCACKGLRPVAKGKVKSEEGGDGWDLEPLPGSWSCFPFPTNLHCQHICWRSCHPWSWPKTEILGVSRMVWIPAWCILSSFPN